MKLIDADKVNIYRKKPVDVPAIKWTGNNLKEIIDFCGGLHPSALKWTWEEYENVVAAEGLKIFGLEGSHLVSIGDMILKGVRGEVWACKPDIFAETYKSVNVTSTESERIKELEARFANSVSLDEVRGMVQDIIEIADYTVHRHNGALWGEFVSETRKYFDAVVAKRVEGKNSNLSESVQAFKAGEYADYGDPTPPNPEHHKGG